MRKSFWKWPVIALLCLGFATCSVVLATEFIDQSILPADSIQNKCTKHDDHDPALIPRPNAGAVKVIHLTNQGEFADRCEFTDTLDEIVWDKPDRRCLDRGRFPESCFNSSVTVKPDAVSKPKLIVLYIHGWMHSALDDDLNYKSFEALISRLAGSNDGKQVLGIYVTWNASTGHSLLDYFSFWSRQRIADRITQSAVVAKIVGAIGSAKGGSRKRDHFVAIGHSFGARMLFAAVNAPLVIDVQKAYPPDTRTYGMVRGIADAVLLLNPAFEAARYTTLNSFMRNEEVFAAQQPPLLITVSTNNDWATQTAFPLGQMFGLSFDERARTTLGNYKSYYTHSLMPSEGGVCAVSDPFDITEEFFAPESKLCLRRESSWHQETEIQPEKDPYQWSNVRPENQKYNPFLVVHTTKEVIDNHGGIWDGKFPSWIFEVLKALDFRNDQLAVGNTPRQTTEAK